MPDTVDISFGSLQGIRGLVFPMVRGCSPSVGTLYVQPQDTHTVGINTLRFGAGQNIVELPECALGERFIRKQGRPILCFQVFDRRWKWQFTSVSGTYNTRLASGLVDPFTQKQPGELASLLLQQMGESGYDVSRMPTGVFPPVSWNASRGDLALAELCDYVACEVVLNPLTNAVEIWPSGQGLPTPTGLTESHPKWRYIPRANVPSTIEVHCGESLYQYRLKLESVFRGTNLAQAKVVDWMIPLTMSTQGLNFPGVDTQLKSALALDTGWREYRVMGQEGGNLDVPGVPVTISNTRQYVLRDHLIYSALDNRTERYQKLPYYIEGDFWPYGDLTTNTSNQVYIGQSDLYCDRLMVKFPFPIIKLDSSGLPQEPTLYLQTAYSVQDENGTRWRWVHQINVGGDGGKLVLHRPEIVATYGKTNGIEVNTQAQAAAESQRYGEIFQQKYGNALASELTYTGILVTASLDGNQAQCTWKITPGQVPSTKVSEVVEADVYCTPAQERRRREHLQRLLEGRA